MDSVLGKQSFKCATFVCQHAEEDCPSIYPFALERLSWPLEDPAAFEGNDDEVVDEIRQVRDQNDMKIQEQL